jgi:hypothetical protein
VLRILVNFLNRVDVLQQFNGILFGKLRKFFATITDKFSDIEAMMGQFNMLYDQNNAGMFNGCLESLHLSLEH